MTTDYSNFYAELMAIRVGMEIFLDRHGDVVGPILYDSMEQLSENIILYLKHSEAEQQRS